MPYTDLWMGHFHIKWGYRCENWKDIFLGEIGLLDHIFLWAMVPEYVFIKKWSHEGGFSICPTKCMFNQKCPFKGYVFQEWMGLGTVALGVEGLWYSITWSEGPWYSSTRNGGALVQQHLEWRGLGTVALGVEGPW